MTADRSSCHNNGVADDRAPNASLLAALTEFAARPDLGPDARNKLALILVGLVDGFEVDRTGSLALKPAALAELLGESEGTLVAWRKKHVGPPFIVMRHGSQGRVLYPVEGVGRWLSEWEFHGSYHADPKVLAAFGIARREPEQVAA